MKYLGGKFKKRVMRKKEIKVARLFLRVKSRKETG